MDAAAGAVKGALVALAEMAVVLLGFLLLQSMFENGNILENILLAVFVVLPLVGSGALAVGFLVGALIKLPRWWLVVPAANAVAFASVRLVPDDGAPRAALLLAVFALAGAVSASVPQRPRHPRPSATA